MKRVIVTGATGFVGRYCISELLQRGFEVIGFTSRRSSIPTPGLSWRHVDLLDISQIHDEVRACDASHLIHLAWETTPGKFWNDPINLVWKSLSVELTKAFVAAGGTRILGVGSCAEYDWDSGVCCEDSTPLRPNTLYGKCKDEARQAMKQVAENAGVSFTWARLFHLYGPGAPLKKMPGLLIESLLDGRPIDCTAGTQQLDFLHASDAGRGLAEILASKVEGPVNLASGQPIRLREMMSLVGETLASPRLIRFDAKHQAAHEPKSITASTDRLETEVEWKPSIDLESGIRATIEWHASLRQRQAA